MSAELDALSVQVRANTDAEQSAVMLLGRLSDLIRAAGTDPAKLSALTHDLDASRQTLAQAVVANTPAAPPPTPTPAPTPTPGPTVSGPGQAPAGPTSTPGAQTPGQSKP